MMPLKLHIAQFGTTIKDSMHINELLQHGKLPYGKAVLFIES